MKYPLVSLAAVLLFLGPTIPAQGQDIKESEYYPFKIGTKWHYKVMDKPIVMRVAKHEKVGDEMCAVVESLVNNAVAATEHVTLRKDGLYRLMMGGPMGGQKVDPPVLFLKLPPKKGETWKIASKIMGQNVKATYEMDEEDIQVPAGKYKAIVTRTKEFEVGDQKMSATIWYAKNVGMVRTDMTVGGMNVSIELEKFEPAK